MELLSMHTTSGEISKDLEYLLYIDLGGDFPGMRTNKWIGMKTFCSSDFANRVYAPGEVTAQDITQVKNFYGKLPFSWWIHESNQELKKLLIAEGFSLGKSYPRMVADLKDLSPKIYPDGLTIKLAKNVADREIWIKLVAETYGMQSAEFKVFVDYLIQHTPDVQMAMYLGYYKNIPATACMMIAHEETVSVHLVATHTEFRGKGLGLAINHYALERSREAGATRAVLAASIMGKSVYEKLGFKELEKYELFIFNK